MVERPYFKDERTVLTARPVIPLQQIDAKVKHRRGWFLGGAFVAAMLLGAASALVSAYLKIRNAPDPQIRSLSVLPLPVSPPPLPAVEVQPERPKGRPLRTTDRTNRTVRGSRDEANLSEDEALRRIRDAVLVDQWQERRQRRVERREERRERRRSQRRDLSHRSGRDLTHVDEIFEGPRRPD